MKYRVSTVILMCLAVIVPAPAKSLGQYDARQKATSNMASSYVPLGSWVYAAFERLASDGYVETAFFDLRPWTRLDCVRLIEEAENHIDPGPASSDTQAILRSLNQEFAAELGRGSGERNWQFRLESLDQRVTSISGRPLTDGYHFAETVVDDDGRPFGEGINVYTGLSLRATAGPFAAYARGEMQRVPSAPAPNERAQQLIAAADFTPVGAAGPHSGFLRTSLLEANVSVAFLNNQFTLGRQSLWWGPGRSSSTLFSNNAEPFLMLRYDRLRPFELPGFLRLLGPIRVQLLVGSLSGAQFVHTAHTTFGTRGIALSDQPLIHAEKFSFKLTPNLEFGVSRSVLFGGQGAPVNAGTFFRSIFSAGVGNEENDPGDRRNAVDAEYRIPALRHCLTGYFDGFSEDQPFPLVYPTESSWLSGFALRCIPHLPHLTLRAEGLLSPHRDLQFPGFFYFNDHYLSGYTNDRQIIGSWIGREGHGEQIWGTWQLSPRSLFEVTGRAMTVSQEFLRGGSLRDLRVTGEFALHPEWDLRLQEQAEWWRFPLLSPVQQRDVSVTVQLSYRPIMRAR